MALRSQSLHWCLTLGALLVGLTVGCGGGEQPPIPKPTKVLPDAARSTVELSRASDVLANGRDEVAITVTVLTEEGTALGDTPVALEVSGEGNTVTPSRGKTNAEGVLRAVLSSTRPGSKRVTATVETEGEPVVLGSRPSVEFVALQPQKLAFAATSLQATAGAPLSPVLEVLIQDAEGATVQGRTDAVTLELATGPAGARLGGTLTVNAVDGVARFSEVVLEKAASGYSLRASAGTLSTATSPSFEVAPAAASVLELTGLPASMTAGGTASAQVTLKDAFDNLATHYAGTLRFSSTDSSAELPADFTFSAADAGRKEFTGLKLKRAGTQRVTVADSANAALTAEAEVQVGADAPASLVFVQQPGSLSVRATFPVLQVRFTDAYDNLTPVSGPAVTLALAPANVLEGTRTVAPVDGVASFSTLSVSQEGTGYTLTASAGSLTSAPSSAFNIVDDVAPASPLLSQGTTTPTTIEVRWTAVGDDGTLGNATSQELRYSTSNIVSDADFNAATPVSLGAPGAPGSAESATLEGLSPGANYYVALKVTDSAGNAVRSATLPVSTPNPTVTQLVFIDQPVSGTAGETLPAVRVALQDSNGDTVTTATSAVTLTLRNGPTLTRTLNAVAGVATFSDLVIETAGTGYDFEASVGGTVPPAQSSTFSISAADVDHLVMVGLVAPVTAGLPGTVQVTAYDAFDNIATDYAGTVAFTSNDPAATLPPNYTFTAGDAGRKVFTDGVVLRTVGERSVTVTDTGNASLTDTLTVDVTSGQATQLVLTASSSTVTAGGDFDLVVTVRDGSGNTALDYTGTVTFSSTDGNAALPSSYTFSAGDAGQKTFTGVTLRTAGSQSITAQDTVAPGLTDTESFTVSAGQAVSLVLSAPATATAGAGFSMTVSAVDAFSNVDPTYTGTVSFTSADTQASLPGSYAFVEADQGSRVFSATLRTAGNQGLSVTDGTRNASATVLVAPASAARLELTGLASPLTAGTTDSIDVTAYDAYDNVATGYLGTVRFTSTDGSAVLPADHTFTSGEAGTASFSVQLRTAGSHTVTVTDTGNGALTAQAPTTIEAAAPSKLAFSQQPANGTVRATLAEVRVALLDAYDNPTGATAPQVQLALTGGGGLATLSGGQPVSPVSGVASFANLSIDQEDTGPTDFQLVASATDLTDATSTAFTLTDNLAPSAAVITAMQSAADSVTVAWQAVGDDGDLGTADHYELRYATSPINNETDFANATLVPTGAPQAPGASESQVVTGLNLGMDHYFALKVFDGANNSSLSNVVRVVGDLCGGVTCTPPASTCTADGTSVVSYTSACQSSTGMCEDTSTTTHCQSYETCSAGACVAVTPGSQAGQVIISEFSALGSEFIELHNTTGADIDVHGYTLRNAAGQMVDIRAPSDPNGTAGTPVMIPAGGALYGVANPAVVPPGVGFVYGPPETSFALADTGDALALYAAAPAGNLQDAVDFRSFITNPNTPLTNANFVGFAGNSTQVDPGSLSATGNDTALNWCVSFYGAGVRGTRVADTRGAANGSCNVAVINEALIDAAGGDQGKVFIEIAGPGGSVIGGARLTDVEGKNPEAGQLNPTTYFNFTFPAGRRIPADGIILVADQNSFFPTQVPNFVSGVDVSTATLTPETGGGDSLQLISASNTLLDALGHDVNGANLDTNTAVNGLAMYESATARYLAPLNNAAASLSRSAASTDTDDNRNDFHADPTPTPGLPNDTVSLTVSNVTPENVPFSLASASITVTGTDFAPNMKATFGSGTEGNCDVKSSTEAICYATSVGSPGRVNSVFKNDPAVGSPDYTLSAGFTFTGKLNETDALEELDFCNIQFPTSLTVQTGQSTGPIYGRIYELGLTEADGEPFGVLAEVGYGPAGGDPMATLWSFSPASYNVQVGNDDEFVGSFTAPMAGNYSYTFRYSFDDGVYWTYCDLNGAGSNPDLTLELGQLAPLTVTP